MSEPIPESIPTSHDPRSRRPTKRRALTPTTAQATHLSSLFAKPDVPIALPPSSSLTTTSSKPSIPPPPEIVANVQGSSAGAGSGEFHVYKASRRREYERVKQMEEAKAKEEADRIFEVKKEELRQKDEEKTGKNRKRRERLKAKKGKKAGKDVEMGEGKGEDVDPEEGSGDGLGGTGLGRMKKLGPAKVPMSGAKGEEEGDAEVVTKSVEDVRVVIHDDD